MLSELVAAADERDRANEWGTAEEQRAQMLELLHWIARLLHVAHMKAPHPEPWEAPRPEHVKALMAAEANKPLSPRQFFARILGRG